MPLFVQVWPGQIRPPVTGDHPIPTPCIQTAPSDRAVVKGFLYVLDKFGQSVKIVTCLRVRSTAGLQLVKSRSWMRRYLSFYGSVTRKHPWTPWRLFGQPVQAGRLSALLGKEALFAAVVNSLCQSTRQAAHGALWRDGLTLDEQLLAAFDETMPHESMELLSELLATEQYVDRYRIAQWPGVRTAVPSTRAALSRRTQRVAVCPRVRPSRHSATWAACLVDWQRLLTTAAKSASFAEKCR